MNGEAMEVWERQPGYGKKEEHVPPGYKRTEVGVIPEEWELASMQQLYSFRNGVNADKSAYGSGVPFVNVLEVIENSHLDAAKVPGRVALSVSVRAEFDLRTGDVVFNRTSETQEEVGLAAAYLGSPTITFGGFVIRGRPTTGGIESVFAGYSLRHATVHDQIVRRGQGAIRANIGHSDLKTVLVPVPPLPEQRAIARALSDVDDLISALDRLIEKKRASKQATMQQLLTGRTRLSGFGGEWTADTLGNVAQLSTGATPSRSNAANWGAGYPWLSIGDLHGKVVSDSAETITPSAAKRMVPVPAGTLLMSFKLSIGRLAFAGRDLFTNEAICAIQCREIVAEYAYYAISRVDFAVYGKQAVKGVTLNREALESILLHLPPLPEQRAIAAVLSDMDAEIAALERRREKTGLVKQGMIQELLTGRTRLVEPAKVEAGTG